MSSLFDLHSIRKSIKLLRFLSYEDRGQIRNVEGKGVYYLIEKLGLYAWVEQTDLVDDDKTCFKTQSGSWIQIVPAYDYIFDIEGFLSLVLNDHEQELNNLTAKAGYILSVDNTISSVNANASATQTVSTADDVSNHAVFLSTDAGLPQGVYAYAYVSNTNEITITVVNNTGNSADLSNNKWYLLVRPLS